MAKRKSSNNRRGPGNLLQGIKTHEQTIEKNKSLNREVARLLTKIAYLEGQLKKTQREIAKFRHVKTNPQAFLSFAHKSWAIVLRRVGRRIEWPVFYIWLVSNDRGLTPKATANVFINQLGGDGLEEYKKKAQEATVEVAPSEAGGDA